VFQPLERLTKAHLPDVHDQIDGAAAAPAPIPVHELGPGHRQDALIGAPLGGVVESGRGPQVFQDHGQGQSAKPVGSGAPVHGSADILVRKVTHSFMLKRWLDSVSRSIKAAVRWGFLRNEAHSLKPRLEVMRVERCLWRFCRRVKKSPTCAARLRRSRSRR